MSQMGQTEKNSVRAYVFRFTPESRHCATHSVCPFRANKRHRRRFLWAVACRERFRQIFYSYHQSFARQRLAYGGLRLLLGFEDVRRHAALRERFAELGVHEGAGGKARHTVEIAFADFLHRVEISVFKFAVELEAVIVHDGVHFVAERLDDGSDPVLGRVYYVDGLHFEFLEIEEQDVVLVVIVEARVEGHPQEILAQPHRLGPEYPGVHQARLAHDRLKIHPVEDVVLDVDPGRDLDQLQTLPCEPEHAALGDIENVLAVLSGIRAGKGAVLDLVDELLVLAVALDQQLALDHRNLEVARRERAAQHHLLRVLADIDEAAGAGQPRAELRHVEIAFLIRLGEPEEGRVETAAVVKVELIRHVDDRLRVGRRAEVEAPGRNAADDPGLGGQGHQVGDFFFGRDGGDPFGHPDAKIDDAVRPQLHRGAARDDLALAHLHRLERGHRHAHLGGERRAVCSPVGLHVALGLRRHDDAIDDRARDLHLPRVERPRLGDALDLRDHQPARVVRRHRERQRFNRQRLALHGDVAVRVRSGAAINADIDRDRLVEQILLAPDRHQFDQIFGRFLVELAAAEARIGEGAKADAGKVPRLAGGDVAVEVGERPQRQVVAFNLVTDNELLNPGDKVEMRTDHPLDEARLGE